VLQIGEPDLGTASIGPLALRSLDPGEHPAAGGRQPCELRAAVARVRLVAEEALALEDIPFRDDSAWATVNLAAVRGITEELAVYLGGGAAWRTIYSQFFDETGERGELGHYWVKDEDRSQVHANILAGAFFRMGNRLVFQFGAETAPAGFSAGMHLLLW
jgi:hypothetical protein